MLGFREEFAWAFFFRRIGRWGLSEVGGLGEGKEFPHPIHHGGMDFSVFAEFPFPLGAFA
jgi:hypothetical protein